LKNCGWLVGPSGDKTTGGYLSSTGHIISANLNGEWWGNLNNKSYTSGKITLGEPTISWIKNSKLDQNKVIVTTITGGVYLIDEPCASKDNLTSDAEIRVGVGHNISSKQANVAASSPSSFPRNVEVERNTASFIDVDGRYVEASLNTGIITRVVNVREYRQAHCRKADEVYFLSAGGGVATLLSKSKDLEVIVPHPENGQQKVVWTVIRALGQGVIMGGSIADLGMNFVRILAKTSRRYKLGPVCFYSRFDS